MPASRTSLRTVLHRPSFSSCAYNAGTMPVVSMLLMNSKKPSSTTCASVNKNTTSPCPSCLYSSLRSSLNCSSP